MGEKKNVILIAAAACFVLIAAGVAGYLLLFSGSAMTKREVKKQMKAAEQSMASEDYQNAVVCYKVVLDKDPGNGNAGEGIISAYLKWADSYVAAGNTPSAIRILEQAVGETGYTNGDQRLADKLKELKASMVVEEPEEEVVEEEEPEEEGPSYLRISIDESDFAMDILGKDLREWDLASLKEFAEKDASMTLYKTESDKKIYRDTDNKIEISIANEDGSVVISDRDYSVIMVPSSSDSYSIHCLVCLDDNPKTDLGQVLSPPTLMEGTVYQYLSGYSEELALYVLERKLSLDEETEIQNATLKVSEYARSNTKVEFRGLTVRYEDWEVDLHLYGDRKRIEVVTYDF